MRGGGYSHLASGFRRLAAGAGAVAARVTGTKGLIAPAPARGPGPSGQTVRAARSSTLAMEGVTHKAALAAALAEGGDHLESAIGRDRRLAPVTGQTLRAHFHLPLHTVAQKFGMCTTAFKKMCRRLGIAKWPHRQVLFTSSCRAPLACTLPLPASPVPGPPNSADTPCAAPVAAARHRQEDCSAEGRAQLRLDGRPPAVRFGHHLPGGGEVKTSAGCHAGRGQRARGRNQ